MRKFINLLAITLFTLCVTLYLGGPYLKIGFASSAHYTDKDKIEYEYYTPEVLKKMPRISNSYEFTYTNVSGPQAYVFSINYHGVSDVNGLYEYLISEGYFLQKTCDVEAECWRSYSNNDVIPVSNFTDPNEVFVDVYRSDYTKSLDNRQ